MSTMSSLARWIAVAAILLSAAVLVTNASTYIGYITANPSEVEWDPYCDFTEFLVTRSCADQSSGTGAIGGWGMHWFIGNQPTLVEPIRYCGDDEVDPPPLGCYSRPWESDANCATSNCGGSENATQDYQDARQAAWNDNAVCMIAHARRSSNYNEIWRTPHPFIYRFFGRTYTFVHNGSLATDNLQHLVGAGFGALDVFNNRPYNGWDPENPSWVLDSELYGMLLMKYFFVQSNYYWDGPSNDAPCFEDPPDCPLRCIGSPEEWAIRRVSQHYPSFDPTVNTSINGILTDGDTLWGIARSNGTGVRRISFFETPWNYKAIVSSTTPSLYTPLTVSGDGEVLILSPNVPADRHCMIGTLNAPHELRINQLNTAQGNQHQPAISVSQAESDYTTAISLAPNVKVFRHGRGLVRMMRADYASAEGDLGQMEPKEANDVYYCLYRVLCLKLADDNFKSNALLNMMPDVYQCTGWVGTIRSFLMGSLRESEFIDLASKEKNAQDCLCEAYYFAGMLALTHKDNGKAREHFERCVATGIVDFTEYALARAELTRHVK